MDSLGLLRELRRAVEGLKAFHEVGRRLTSTLDPREVLGILLEKVGETFQPAAWALVLADRERGDLEVALAVGEGAEALRGKRVAPGAGILGEVAASGNPVLLDDVRADPRYSADVDPVPAGDPRSYMAVPLRTVGMAIGAVAITARDGEPFRPDDLRTLGGLADYAAIALSNARNFERVRELTLVDEHTGLFNTRHLQRALEAEVARSARYHRPVSLIFLDLDLFKSVNDSHGHQAGSELLREVGEVIRSQLRSIDVPVRYGGDEFVVMLPESSREHATIVAERLRSAIRGRTFLAGRDRPVRITASFGIGTWPDDGETPEDLLLAADGAMYRAKAAGRDAIATGKPT